MPAHYEVERHVCACGSWVVVDDDTGDLLCEVTETAITPPAENEDD